MDFIAIITGVGLGIASFFLLRMSGKEMSNKRQVADLVPVKISDIKPGLVLISGEVVCNDPVKTPYTQTSAAWYRYEATQRHKRQQQAGFYEEKLAAGEQICPFMLKDSTGEINIEGKGITVVSYPHSRILKSKSGRRASLKERMKKLKEMDNDRYPEGEKKPFFRKIEAEDAPLDIPDDLIELSPGSPEIKTTLNKYYEFWIQQKDNVFIAGTAVKDANGSKIKITKAGENTPFFMSSNHADLKARAFQKNFLVLLLAGAGMAIAGFGLVIHGIGIF